MADEAEGLAQGPPFDGIDFADAFEIVEVAADGVGGVGGIGDEAAAQEGFHGLAQQALLGVLEVDFDDHSFIFLTTKFTNTRVSSLYFLRLG